MSRPDLPLSIYVVALEPSAQAIAASVMLALGNAIEHKVCFAGVGGGAMKDAGLEASLFDPQDVALLGLTEVVPKIPLVLRRVRKTLADIQRVQPDVLFTVDSWGFTGRLHRALAGRGSAIKRIHAPAPQVWAWRPGRAKKLARDLDLLLALFPFEPPLFEKHGLRTVHIGHPVTQKIGFSGADGMAFRQRHQVPADQRVLGVLPGSRAGELSKLLPIFANAAARLQAKSPDLKVVVPTFDAFVPQIQSALSSAGVRDALIVTGDAQHGSLPAMTAAIAASGTVTLELARAGVPHVIGYKVNPITGALFQAVTLLTHVNLVNILADTPVIPELLQADCTTAALAEQATQLLEDTQAQQAQKSVFSGVIDGLSPPEGTSTPGQAAARAIYQLLCESHQSDRP